MGSSQRVPIMHDFSVENIPEIRKTLSVTHQKILDEVWRYYFVTDQNFRIRGLPPIIGKQTINDALEGINKVFISEADEMGSKAYKLNVLGALLTSDGDVYTNVYIRVLDLVRELYLDDPNLQSVSSEIIIKRLKLTESEAITFYKLLRLYGLYNIAFQFRGGTQSEWEISISDEIVDFFYFENSTSYLSAKLNNFYVTLQQNKENPPSFSVMDYLRESHHSIQVSKESGMEPIFISSSRIQALQALKSASLDFTRLLNLCDELNECFQRGNVHAVAMLTRAILDHIPPIFGHMTFKEVSANYGTKSFKKSAERLDKQLRTVADKLLHTPIRQKEIAPDIHEVSFSSELESILYEICRISK